jgi:hypothetical protein
MRLKGCCDTSTNRVIHAPILYEVGDARNVSMSELGKGLPSESAGTNGGVTGPAKAIL